MRTGRAVLFTNDAGQKLIGQVASINPAGGATIQTAPNTEPIPVEKFHKLRPINLADAVNEMGATLSNSGLSFPNGLNITLEQLGEASVDLTNAVSAFVGIPLGDESVPNPFEEQVPVMTDGDEEDQDGDDPEDSDTDND